MSDVTTSPNGDHHLSILLEFPWGKSHLETVTLRKNDCSLVDNHNSECAVLTCETELDLAVFAYLSNSLSEKQRGGETTNVSADKRIWIWWGNIVIKSSTFLLYYLHIVS